MVDSEETGICRRVGEVRTAYAGRRGKSHFARELGLSPSTYAYYESTRVPPAEVLAKIAELTGADLAWLITGREGAKGSGRAGQGNAFFRQGSPGNRQGSRPEPEGSADTAGPSEARGDSATPEAPAERAARLLAAHPAAGEALEAFLDVLEQRFHWPDARAAEPAADSRAEGASDDASSEPPPEPRWSDALAVLGRTAAGVPCFWEAGEDASGLTTLADRVSQLGRSRRRDVSAHLAGAAAEDDRPVSLVTLSSPDADDVVEYLRAPSLKRRWPDAFCVRVDGDSMEPEYRHGDLVVLSPSQPAVDGRAAVVQLAGQIGVTCKLFRRAGDRVHLVAINERYPPTAHAADELLWALRVLGRVRSGD